MEKTFNYIMNNLSTIVLCFVSIITAISPIITAIINNRHTTKIKELEMYEVAKQQSLQDFVDNCCSYFSCPSDNNLKIKVLSSMHKLLIYFDIDKYLQNNILEAINQGKNKLLNEVILNLSKQVKKI